MDNPTTILTGMMFVTILGLAIGIVLSTCAEIAGGLRDPQPQPIHISWIALTLLALLNLFWETTVLLEVEQWKFIDFLYTVAGPMLLFFAASVITSPSRRESSSRHSVYFSLCQRFFLMLALHEVWQLGIDWRYGTFTNQSVFDGVLIAVFPLLAVSKSYRVHLLGAVVTWVVFITTLILRALGSQSG